MENFEGGFIATTNLIKTLDQAALRRFDMKLLFKPLTARQSRELFLRHAATLGIADTLNNPRLKARGFLTRCRLSRNRQGF
jgi:SpoVK/Ycf46/Vps4 family AAA+-type ATPase